MKWRAAYHGLAVVCNETAAAPGNRPTLPAGAPGDRGRALAVGFPAGDTVGA